MPTPLHRALALLMSALLLSSVAMAAGGDGYRLAGVLAVGPDYLAILELPGGQQQLVRQGAVLEDGTRVVAVKADRLRIVQAGRTVELNLDGAGGPAQVPAALGVVQEQSDTDRVMVRSVDAEAFSASAAQAGKAATGSTPSRNGRGDPAAEIGRRLAPILNLPTDSRVVAVNEQPVRSAEEAIRLIEQSFSTNTAPRLNITSAAGDESRVYLSAAQP
jgi:hypothetical protein